MPRTQIVKPIFLLLLLALIWFSNIQYRDLFKPDEGRYAEIPREMVASGDWVTPHLNGFKYFEKPPLQYWATATAYTLFGQHNWTARLWSYLTGFGSIVLVWFAGKRLFGPTAGCYGALILASSLYYGILGRVNSLDTGLTFFLTAALTGFLLAQRTPRKERSHHFWMMFAWAAAGLAVLSKGLIGLVIPGATCFFYAVANRDWRFWQRLSLVRGITLFLLLVAPWFVLVCWKNPEFFNFFFIHEHFDRYLTKVHRRFEPWWFFLPYLLAGVLPWLVEFCQTIATGWRRTEPKGSFDPSRFTWIWIVAILIFFSLSHSKLIPYIVPLFPPLALLMGCQLSKRSTIFKWDAVISVIFALAGLIFLFFFGLERFGRPKAPAELYVSLEPWAITGFLIMLAGGCGAWLLKKRQNGVTAIATLGVSWILGVHIILTGVQMLSPAYSTAALAQKIAPIAAPTDTFYCVGNYDQTLPFYLNRTCRLVDDRGELDFGIKQNPELWIKDIPAFVQLWQAESSAFAVMRIQTYEDLKAEIPMVEIARDPRRVVVIKP
ncbi:MAG: glycosyltransferase family 39 protein [Desulfuromonadaceae bacterium]|nr:glycosyltransferase family 39 protein [Desulfuromonas sp.]MDY0184866.1 glycosyltransferase family 39 protein [Desulfuromonadaceae bacterium]